MAKRPKVPLNVLVVEGTRHAVKSLADTLECSQGEVVDRAVVLLGANYDVAKGLAMIQSDAPRERYDTPITQADTEQTLAAIPVVDTRPKNAYCKHCGKRFAGARFSTICPDCKGAGHTLAPSECPKCNEATSI